MVAHPSLTALAGRHTPVANAVALPLAILHQGHVPPAVDGVRKPRKPGGYIDSAADMAWALHRAGRTLCTPIPDRDPAHNSGWSFPDTSDGIAAARAAGAEVLWANTVLYAGHPLEAALAAGVAVVGQLCAAVQIFDDKYVTHQALDAASLAVPRTALLTRFLQPGALHQDTLTARTLAAHRLAFPLMLKPVRGRGSQGVTYVADLPALRQASAALFAAHDTLGDVTFGRYGDALMIEEYLPGDEITITVMPPGDYRAFGQQQRPAPWALPPVARVGHRAGVAPYSGDVPVSANSTVLPTARAAQAPLRQALHDCERAASLVCARAPIRIDCRADASGVFRLFDLNMKPNLTGAGRPGRDTQDSLVVLAGRAAGWSYPTLLTAILSQAYALTTPST